MAPFKGGGLASQGDDKLGTDRVGHARLVPGIQVLATDKTWITGTGGREDAPLSGHDESKTYLPVNFGARFSTKLATPSLKSELASEISIARLASMVASASDWNGTS